MSTLHLNALTLGKKKSADDILKYFLIFPQTRENVHEMPNPDPILREGVKKNMIKISSTDLINKVMTVKGCVKEQND